MEFVVLLILIFLIIIFMKLSNVESQLEHIEKLIKMKSRQSVEEKKLEKSEIILPPLTSPPIEEKASLSMSSTVPLSVQLKKAKQSTEQRKESIKEKKKEPVQKSLMERLEEYSPSGSLEELLFGNIILKIAIVAFILGIGLFLKYSIDKDWIPIWGRVLIGIMVGISMLVGGIKMIKNRHKLFSEALFGGGIAVLYLSIFSAFALDGFKVIDANFAYVAMIAITILAGLISIRFDAKSTAIFGLIGGFSTPFLLSTGSGNYVGLLSYMLMLNLGVLYISLYKKWSLLAWMAFAITALTQLLTVERTTDSFIPLLLLYGVFFIIYSIVPFIREMKEDVKVLEKHSVFLFWANFLVAILSFLLLFIYYHIDLLYYAGVTVGLAGYLLSYALLLTKKNKGLKNLFYIVLAQSIALLLITPAFIFSDSSLTIVWAVESLMLLWVATKSKESLYALFGLFGFVVTVGRYLVLDLFADMTVQIYSNTVILDYVQRLTITSLFVISSLFAGYKLLRESDLTFKYFSNDILYFSLFSFSFFGGYGVLTFITSMLLDIYSLNIFLMLYMLIIAFFAYLFTQSDYRERSKFVYYFFMALLLLGFIQNISSISAGNTVMSLFNFLIFMAVVGFIYTIAFKQSEQKISGYSVSHIMLTSAVGLLFIFLNVEFYHLVKIYDATATKFAITLLWVLFGITLFVYGILKDIKISKLTGTVLLFIAILKAFFVDLSKLDSIYRIVLFLILGAILFALSYFYQSKQSNDMKDKE